jgi:hypothetical protein
MPEDWTVGMVRVEGRARIPSSARKGRSTTATLRQYTSIKFVVLKVVGNEK